MNGKNMEKIQSGSKTVVVGVGDYKISTSPLEVLVTYNLGSCLGVAAYDPRAGVGGLLHFMLPDSRINSEKAQTQPAMFADTGLAVFLNELFALGATRRGIILKLAGASKVLKDGEFFDIGRRNALMAKKLLWKNSLGAAAEETGGEVSRTLRLRMEDGRTLIKDAMGEHEL
jgi:chemotaxis protein CheD